ncbi:hypothetical protein Nepgr_024350 [Nepenthes gracilis]|uniref:Uncharacterized protein n=1 Tax=Nepenthes gracilis TaxID=150966 RepID=A0AAD3T4G4_NEPGR|nr:hypothetical protein Nepgr_024350 [Nepenthes gracilis]
MVVSVVEPPPPTLAAVLFSPSLSARFASDRGGGGGGGLPAEAERHTLYRPSANLRPAVVLICKDIFAAAAPFLPICSPPSSWFGFYAIDRIMVPAAAIYSWYGSESLVTIK